MERDLRSRLSRGTTTAKQRSDRKPDIENVPIDKLQAFYRKYYQPDNAVLMVAGKVDEGKTLALIAESFGEDSSAGAQADPTYTVEPTQDGERNVTRSARRRCSGHYGALQGSRWRPRRYGSSGYFGYGPGGHTVRTPAQGSGREQEGGKYDGRRDDAVGARCHAVCATVRKDGNLDDAQANALRVIHDITKEPPTQEEVERAKRAELKNWEMAFNDSERVGLMLSEPISRGDWRLTLPASRSPQEGHSRRRAACREDVYKRGQPHVGMFRPVDAPDRAEIPAVTDKQALLKDFKGSARSLRARRSIPVTRTLKAAAAQLAP